MQSSDSYFGDLEYYGVFRLATATKQTVRDDGKHPKSQRLEPYEALRAVEDSFMETLKTILYHRKYDPAYTSSRDLDPSKRKIKIHDAKKHPGEMPRQTRVVLYGPEARVSALLVRYLIKQDRKPMDLKEALRILLLSWPPPGVSAGATTSSTSGHGAQLEPGYFCALRTCEEKDGGPVSVCPSSFVIEPKDLEKLRTKEDVMKLLWSRFAE